MTVPVPTHIYRIIHIDNFEIYLRREGLHAPNHCPDDGLIYRDIHDVDVERVRRVIQIPCGPKGTVQDYVSFYLGPRSPMLLRLHTHHVEGYDEGQEPIIYLVSAVQKVTESGAGFAFSDGHGLAHFTEWFDDLNDLDQVDWEAVEAIWWNDTPDDPDRQRRKQAEFLVHEFCDWSLIIGIGVIDEGMKERVTDILNKYPDNMRPPVKVVRKWYY